MELLPDWVERFRCRLYAYVLTLLPNRADADDVLQETSLVMWDKFDPADPPADFLAWARRVAYHKVLDFYKKSRRADARLEFDAQTASALASRRQGALNVGCKPGSASTPAARGPIRWQPRSS